MRPWHPYPDLDLSGQKWPTNMEKVINFIFLSAACSLLKGAECFSCSLDIGKLIFLISCIYFSSVFGQENPGSELDPEPDPDWIRNRIHSSSLLLFVVVHSIPLFACWRLSSRRPGQTQKMKRRRRTAPTSEHSDDRAAPAAEQRRRLATPWKAEDG